MKSSFVFRVRIISGVVALVAAVFVVRLYTLQIVHGEELSAKAERQYVRPDQNQYDRGSIFFKDKDGRLVSAATLKSGFTIALAPRSIEDTNTDGNIEGEIESAYESISALLPIDRDTFFLRAGKRDDPYEEIAKRVEPDVAKQVDTLKIPGVNIYRERWRYYPGNSLAAHTVGFVGYDGEGYSGRYGLERFYEDTLARKNSGAYVNFFAEIFSNIKNTITDNDTSREGDLITSIEPSVQLFLDGAVAHTNRTWNSNLTGAVIMDPKTGEIYAMSLYPTFDLNNFKDAGSASVYANPLVEGVYELGSIMKPLTMAIGLDTGAVKPETTYYDAGHIILDKAKISNFDGKGRGTVPMQEILNQSLNTGAAFVEQRVGNKRFADYMFRLGFDKETGIDLPHEGENLIENLHSPRDVEYATASFGQGIALTPMTIVRALAALGNGGLLVTPHVVTEVKYQSGFSRKVGQEPGVRVFKPETSEEISRMLVTVVDTALRGGAGKFAHHSVAAKTGTAQIAKEGERGYYDDRYLHSFFGYFPAFDPQFLIFLFTIEPKGVRYASETLTQPFLDTVKFLINYYEVPPDR